MKSSRRVRGVLLAVAVTAVVTALFGWVAPQAEAFYVLNHERIVRDALPAGEVDDSAVVQILVGPPPGAGAVGSDALFNDVFRHIDNAKNPGEICARLQDAWNFFIPTILTGAQPTGPGGSDLVNGPAARAAFGGLAHALEDFYSHSNWVEDNIAVNQPERMPPPLMPTCDPATLPAALHTGFFSMEFSSQFPVDGCPPGGPPPGFAECHATLNKDAWDTERGSVPVPGQPMNYFDLAALLATRATTDLFWQVRGLVANNAGECAARNLFQADRHEACWG